MQVTKPSIDLPAGNVLTRAIRQYPGSAVPTSVCLASGGRGTITSPSGSAIHSSSAAATASSTSPVICLMLSQLRRTPRAVPHHR